VERPLALVGELEFDRVPKGRDDGDAFQTSIRRHDEY
jgi:hypothetical protein